jgi:hypothetical protein
MKICCVGNGFTVGQDNAIILKDPKFIVMFTRTFLWAFPWARQVHTLTPERFKTHFNNILSNVCLGCPYDIFFSHFPT